MRHLIRAFAMFSILLACSGTVSQGKEPANKFQFKLGPSGVTGSEEYRIEKSPTGYKLTSEIRLNIPGRATTLMQEQSLTSDWGLDRYKMGVLVAGQTQLIEAWRDGQEVQIKINAQGQTLTKTVPYHERTLVMDNAVASHYQILLNKIAANPPGQEWSMVVPQALTAIHGKLGVSPAETGELNGRSFTVSKYTLELGNVMMEFYAEAQTNQLMRVAVPIQGVDMVREGFTVTPKKAVEVPEEKAWIERTLTFPSGDLQVPGTLTLPSRMSGRIPVVVLVHGSGPNDRDETIGPNKPFRDLAQGLAGLGIATLRYDKRTFAFRPQINVKTLTVDQEVTDDAVAALTFVRTLPETNPAAVFILGHSLGAMMAPFIAERAPFTRGAVLMAAGARPLDDLMCEQVAFGMKLTGGDEKEVSQQVAELKKAFSRIRSGEATDTEIILFASARYWRDLFGRDNLAAMSRAKIPMLILQGGKDVQVVKTDYDLIQKAVAAKPLPMRESHWYPNLNHLFMPVEGEATGAEYGRSSHVQQEVITDIAGWVKSHVDDKDKNNE